jgi:hypothetical protein
MSAVSLGLTGTVLVGLWLTNSGDLSGNRLRLPAPLEHTIAWLEERGWGQRVLLPGRPGVGATGGARLPGTSTGSSAPISAEPATRGPVSLPAGRTLPALAPRSRPPVRSSPDATATRSAPSAVAAPPSAPDRPAAVATRLVLSAPASSVVGQSVRLVATVEAEGSPRAPVGQVVFYADGAEIGRTSVRQGTAVLSTLALDLGPHELRASYEGDDWHLASSSGRVALTVRRQ